MQIKLIVVVVGLESGMVFKGTTGVYKRIYSFYSK